MTEREKVLDRIRKLLSLATSSNRAESQLAMMRAQELLNRYQVDEAELDRGKVESFSHFIKRKRVPKWQVSLMNIVARNNFCLFVWGGNYQVPINEDDYDDLAVPMEIIGRKSNVEVTKMMFDYLVGTANRLVKEYCSKHGRSAKRPFLYGFVSEIHERLKQTKASWTEAEKTALIRIENQDKADIEKFIKENGRDLRLSSGRAKKISDHTISGMNSAKSVNLSRQMGSQQKLIGG